MTRNAFSLSPLTLALLALSASPVLAQSLPTPPAVSRAATSLVAPAAAPRANATTGTPVQAASIETRAALNGRITQNSNPSIGGNELQAVAVGSVANVSGAVGSLTAQGEVSGSLSQFGGGQRIEAGAVKGALTAGSVQAQGSLVGSVSQDGRSQMLQAGVVEGDVRADSVRAEGHVSAPITQTNRNGALSQTVAAGRVADSQGSLFSAEGTISGRGVAQTSSGGPVVQRVEVGVISGSAAQRGIAVGVLTGQVTQDGAARGESTQSLRVGTLTGSQGRDLEARGSFGADLTQTLRPSGGNRADQTVSVGSIESVDAAGTVSASGTVGSGRVSQSQTGLGGSQALEVGSVKGGTPQDVRTEGTLSGSVTQEMGTGDLVDLQVVQVGGASQVSGTVRTQATVQADIVQTMSSGVVRGQRQQIVEIGQVAGTSGNVSTLASVNGTIAQSQNGGMQQRISLGSVKDTGNARVRAEVLVDGTIRQSGGVGSQSVDIGSVRGVQRGESAGTASQ